LTIVEGIAEPRAGTSPVPVGSASTDAHDFGCLGERQAGKGSEIHQLGPRRILARQGLQSLVERQQVVAGWIAQQGIEVDPDAAAAKK